MWSYVFKRLLHMIPLLLGVSLLTFLLMALSPGNYFTALLQNPQISPDTVARLKAQFHLDQPWYVQYCYWLANVLRGNFGYSMAYHIPATALIVGRLWNTFLLSFSALIIAWSRIVGRPCATSLSSLADIVSSVRSTAVKAWLACSASNVAVASRLSRSCVTVVP